jgi:hypothetical protein
MTRLEPGAVYRVDGRCGVPHGFRPTPMEFRLIKALKPKDSHAYPGMAWLDGYEIDRPRGGQERLTRRQIYVITDGLELIYSPTAIAAMRARIVRAAGRNERAVATRSVPRPRTPIQPNRSTR